MTSEFIHHTLPIRRLKCKTFIAPLLHFRCFLKAVEVILTVAVSCGRLRAKTPPSASASPSYITFSIASTAANWMLQTGKKHY